MINNNTTSSNSKDEECENRIRSIHDVSRRMLLSRVVREGRIS